MHRADVKKRKPNEALLGIADDPFIAYKSQLNKYCLAFGGYKLHVSELWALSIAATTSRLDLEFL